MSDVPPSSRSSRPARRRRSSESAPPGIKIICVVGWLGAFLGLFPILALVGGGGGAAFLGLVLLVLTVAQVYVLYGLWTLRSWAWTWTMILYGLGIVGDLLAANILGLVIGLLLLAYVYSKRDYYR